MTKNNKNESYEDSLIQKEILGDLGDQFINDDFISLIEYNIFLYPETQYSVVLVNNVTYTKEIFEKSIILHFKEEYEIFKETSNLKIINFYKKENNNYIPITIKNYNEIPSPLFVEFSSDNVWVKTNLNIKTNTHVFISSVNMNIRRELDDYSLNVYLVKTSIHLWVAASKEEGDMLQLHYILTKTDVNWNKKIANNKENSNCFFFNLEVYLTMNSIEELFVNELLKDNLLSRKIKNFENFVYDSNNEEDYNNVKENIQNYLFELNKDNSIYLYHATGKLQYKINNIKLHQSKRDQNDKGLHLIVWPKNNKRAKVYDTTNISNYSLNSIPQFSIGINQNNPKGKRSLSIRQSQLSFRKTFQENLPYKSSNNYKEEDEYELQDYEEQTKNGKINFIAGKLYKTYEESDTEKSRINRKRTDERKNSLNIENHPFFQNDIQINVNNRKNSEDDSQFAKLKEKTMVKSIIDNNSRIKFKKFEIDQCPTLKTKNFTYVIKFKKSIERRRKKVNKKNKTKMIIISVVIFSLIIFIIFIYLSK